MHATHSSLVGGKTEGAPRSYIIVYFCLTTYYVPNTDASRVLRGEIGLTGVALLC